MKTIAVLREMANRIADQCAEAGREDLVRGVYLFEQLADRAALKSSRNQLLDIIECDNQTLELGSAILLHNESVRRAMVEKTMASSN